MVKAICLSGGGSKGAAEIGILEYLLEQNPDLEYNIIAGNSVGAINASFLATGPLKETIPQLKDIWLNQVKGNHSVWTHHIWYYLLICIAIISFCSLVTFALFIISFSKIINIICFIITICCLYLPYRLLNSTVSIYKTDQLRHLITKNLDIEKLKNSGKKLIIGATSYDTGEYKSIQTVDDKIIDWIMASSSFPIFFPMQFIDEEYWTDGGLTSIAPLSDILKFNEITEVDVIITSPFDPGKTSGKGKGIIKQLIRSLDIISSQSMQMDFLVRTSVYPGLKITFYIPDKPLTSNPLDFSADKIKEMYEAGREIAKKKLNK